MTFNELEGLFSDIGSFTTTRVKSNTKRYVSIINFYTNDISIAF